MALPRRSARKTNTVNYAETERSISPPSERSVSPAPQSAMLTAEEHRAAVAALMEANAGREDWSRGLSPTTAALNPTHASSRSTTQRSSTAKYRRAGKGARSTGSVHGGRGLFTYDSGDEGKRNASPSPGHAHTRTPQHIESSLKDVEGLAIPPSDEWLDTLADPDGPMGAYDPIQATTAIAMMAIAIKGARPPVTPRGIDGRSVVVHDARGSEYRVSLRSVARKIAEWVASVETMRTRVDELEEVVHTLKEDNKQLDELKEAVHTLKDDKERQIDELKEVINALIERQKRPREEEEEEEEEAPPPSPPPAKKAKESHPCKECTKEFDTKKQLWQHITKVHRKSKPTLKCDADGCDYVTHRRDLLKKHKANTHKM